jgi:hypothetical protein
LARRRCRDTTRGRYRRGRDYRCRRQTTCYALGACPSAGGPRCMRVRAGVRALRLSVGISCRSGRS